MLPRRRLGRGTGWTRSSRLVLVDFDSFPDRLGLTLFVGPGVGARAAALDRARGDAPAAVLRVSPGGGRNQKWKAIFARCFLKLEHYEQAEFRDLGAQIEARQKEFVDRDLPALVALIPEGVSSITASLAGGEHARVATSEVATEAGQDQ